MPNPTPGQPEPGTASLGRANLDLGTIDTLTINNYGGFTTDELRLGPAFASVTPSEVPEPSFGLAVGLAGLLMYLRPRSRQQR